MEITSIIKDNTFFIGKENVVHFIKNDNERPKWSRVVDNYYINNPQDLKMDEKYEFHCERILDDIQMSSFFQYITEPGGIIVDLASGPSGYFGPVFDFLKNDSIFIATDASKEIINAHKNANKDNSFFLFEVDLDRGLPFRDGCIDAFSGNLLNNVNNYKGLLSEVARCLKTNGRFAVIELFYESGSKTYDYLKGRDAVYSSLDNYIAVCNEFGLRYKDSVIRKEIIGKLAEGDLIPIGDKDKCFERIVYFEKI